MITKRDYLIALSFFIVGVIVTSAIIKYQSSQAHYITQTNLTANQANQVKLTNSSTPTIPNSQPMNTYTNSRFGFSIDFPTSWPEGKESVNGDGTAIYDDKPNNQILVYGSNIPSTFSTQDDPVERENVTLNNGSVVTTLKSTDSSGKINYIMFFNKNNKQYVFYATVTKEFFSKNEQDILNALKSFKVWR